MEYVGYPQADLCWNRKNLTTWDNFDILWKEGNKKKHELISKRNKIVLTSTVRNMQS